MRKAFLPSTLPFQNVSPFNVTEITSVAGRTNLGQIAAEWAEELSNLFRDMAASPRQVSLQPLALGWSFDPRVSPTSPRRSVDGDGTRNPRLRSLRLHRNVHLFNCGVAGFLQGAGQRLSDTFAVDGPAAQGILALWDTRQEGCPMNSRQSHWPRKGLAGCRIKAECALIFSYKPPKSE